MRIRFQSKILLLFVSLIAIVQCATALAVIDITGQEAAQRTQEKLAVGNAVFRADMADREAKLRAWVHVLSRDFGLIEALATGEPATIQSALANHGGRLDADLALMVTPDGTILAESGEPTPPSAEHPLRALIDRAGTRSAVVSFVMLEGHAYQVVVTPVRAPKHIAWVCMAFLVDDAVAQSVKRKTLLDVSFVARSDDDRPILLASTLTGTLRAAIHEALLGARHPLFVGEAFLLTDTDYLTQLEPLEGALPGERLYVMLQTSQSEALRSHRKLRSSLLALTLVALAIATAVALVVSRSITRPVEVLLRAAQRITAGDYDQPVELSARDEMATLAEAFNEMQSGIAAREAQIVFQASHDRLTGLYSRIVVHELLEAALARAGESEPVAIVIARVARFKEINDKLGHAMGDRVLQAVAAAVRDQAQQGDSAIRLSGDEFMLILSGCEPDAAVGVAEQVATRARQSIVASALHVALDLSFGVAVHPDHGSRPEVLLRRADIALFHARRTNTPVLVYAVGQDELHLRRLALMGDLVRTIRGSEFQLHYQPKIQLESRDVVLVEALLRWESPTFGNVRPDEFIPLAEESGYIHSITQWVLDSAIAQCAQWRARGVHIGVSVNLSALDLTRDSLLPSVTGALARHQVPASALVLEVTETALVQNLEQAIRSLEALRARGVKIALDDFGIGHSSLAQLKRMPVDKLKIDKTFVQQLKPGSEDACIVRAIIQIAHGMGLTTVAEGVEDATAMRLLEELGCDMIQGYYISRPLPAAAFEAWLRDYYEERIPHDV